MVNGKLTFQSGKLASPSACYTIPSYIGSGKSEGPITTLDGERISHPEPFGLCGPHLRNTEQYTQSQRDASSKLKGQVSFVHYD